MTSAGIWGHRRYWPSQDAESLSEADALGRILGGEDDSVGEAFVLSRVERTRHLYILGATGSGKTNLILQLLAHDVAANESILVVDLRGDLVDRVLIRLAAQDDDDCADRVTLIDLRDNDHIIGFNPLSGSAEAHSRAFQVLDALRSQSESWGIQLEETLRNCLIALAECGMTLLDVEPMLTDSTVREAVLAQVTDTSVQAFFVRYAELSSEKQQSWFLPVLNKVTPLLGIPRLRLLFGASNPIDLNKLLDTPGQIILVALGIDRFHSAARLAGSLLIGAIESAIMARVDQSESARNPVQLYVDEFEAMATEAFGSIVAEGRRFGLSLTLSHQNLSQVPPNLRQAIRNNIRTQVFFQTGSIDARELRHELILAEDEDVAIQLQTLPVGQAYVVKRPDAPVKVRFHRSNEPAVARAKRAAFVERVHAAQGSLTPAQALKATAAGREDFSPRREPQSDPAGNAAFRHDRGPKRARKER